MGDFGAARLISNLCEQQEPELLTSEADEDDELLTSSLRVEDDAPLLSADAAMTRHTGTVLYSAPEVLLSEAYGSAADAYR